MITDTLKKIFGTRNDRELKRIRKMVTRINRLEEEFQALDDQALRAKTDEFRSRLTAGANLDELLPEAFATVREAGQRTLGMRHFDVQLIGGIVLHEGKIAEMRTGEGKTLVATLPAYLNALAGDAVHLVTVNDYLAGRDAAWMGPIYNFLGMTVGVIRSGQGPAEKRDAYACDIVYGTNNEFGFDYLRDNMAFAMADKAQARLGLVCHGKRHVVPQVIKTKLVVGSINNIAGVGVPLLGGPLPRANDPDRHAKKIIDGPHPGGIAPRQIVVHGHQVHRITSQRVEVGGQSRNQCLALTGAHFRNLAFMEDDAADQLHIEMPHTQCPLARFANRRKRLG